MNPSLSIIIPTAGRKELEVCLASVVPQLSSDDEVIVVGDITDGPQVESQYIAQSFGSLVRYLPGPRTEHTFGHREINYGIGHANGQWLSFNDDDDTYVPGAIDVIRSTAAVAQDRPILFRFLSYHGIVFWTNRMAFQQEQVGGHCLVCRNIPGKLGLWADHYQGDWSFVEQTVELQGGSANIIWKEDIIALARPSEQIARSVLSAAGRLRDKSA